MFLLALPGSTPRYLRDALYCYCSAYIRNISHMDRFNISDPLVFPPIKGLS